VPATGMSDTEMFTR